MTGLYYINEQNARLSYGLLFEPGTFQELLSFPNAWPNEQRKISLPLVIVGSDEVDFWIKYNNFKTLLNPENEIILHVVDLHRRFKLSFDGITNFKKISNITGLGKVCFRFTLILIDDYPDVKTFTKTASFTSEITGEVKVFQRIYSSFSMADASALADNDAFFDIDGQNYANGNDYIEIEVPEPSGSYSTDGYVISNYFL